MVLTFPAYLNEPQYEYRHLKLHIIKNTLNLSSADDLAAAVLQQAKDMVKLSEEKSKTTGKGSKDIKDEKLSIEQALAKINNQFAEKIHTLVLPLPNDLQDSHSHSWGEQKGAVATIADSFLGSNSLINGGKQALGMAADSLGIRKPLLDPAYWQNYTGTAPRTFSLSFDFVPRNTMEASDMYNIIQMMRKYSLPESVIDSTIVLAPHYFDIELSNSYLDTMINFKGVVITSMNVNYGADGNMQQHADGIPKHVRVDLGFTERRMSLSEYYPTF